VTALSVRGLTVAYDDTPAVDDLSFEVEVGRLVGIVGPNGAGKTTTIKAIMGALPIRSGEVEVLGRRGKAALEELVYVPQRASVDWDFPLTVRDVVMQGRYGSLGLLRRPRKADHQRVDAALNKVAIADLAQRQIGELSGGQQQRVFLARALAQDGRVYLMDEPFQGVDATTEAAIIEVLRTLRAAEKTVLVVHHDLSTVKAYFDEVLLLNVGLIAYGETETVFTPDQLQKAYGGRLALFGDAAVVA
jgi:manganese/zinc/iron transport system ATP- binding protein